jgi:hypothetical protein
MPDHHTTKESDMCDADQSHEQPSRLRSSSAQRPGRGTESSGANDGAVAERSDDPQPTTVINWS